MTTDAVREQRVQTVRTHMEAENRHDFDAVIDTTVRQDYRVWSLIFADTP